MKLKEYEVHFNDGTKIMFVTENDLKRGIENETLLSMWDYHKEKFIVFRNITFVRYLGEFDTNENTTKWLGGLNFQ